MKIARAVAEACYTYGMAWSMVAFCGVVFREIRGPYQEALVRVWLMTPEAIRAWLEAA